MRTDSLRTTFAAVLSFQAAVAQAEIIVPCTGNAGTDTAALQDAVDDAVAAAGERILLENGVCLIDTTIEVTGNYGFTIAGEGFLATRVEWRGADGEPLFLLSGGAYMKISDLYVGCQWTDTAPEPDVTNYASAGFDLRGGGDVTFERLRIDNCKKGIKLGEGTNSVEEVNIRDVVIYGPRQPQGGGDDDIYVGISIEDESAQTKNVRIYGASIAYNDVGISTNAPYNGGEFYAYGVSFGQNGRYDANGDERDDGDAVADIYLGGPGTYVIASAYTEWSKRFLVQADLDNAGTSFSNVNIIGSIINNITAADRRAIIYGFRGALNLIGTRLGRIGDDAEGLSQRIALRNQPVVNVFGCSLHGGSQGQHPDFIELLGQSSAPVVTVIGTTYDQGGNDYAPVPATFYAGRLANAIPGTASPGSCSSGTLCVDDDLEVTGDTTLDGALAVAALESTSTLQGTRLISTVSTGTAPITVASTTAVANLNADMVDGVHASAFATLSGDNTFSGTNVFNDDATLYGSLDASGKIMSGQGLGGSCESGNVCVDDGLDVSGSLSVAGTGSVNGQLTAGGLDVFGPLWVEDTGTVNGQFMLAGGMSDGLSLGSSTQVLHGGSSVTWGAVADGDLANDYSGVGSCAAGASVTSTNDNAAPTCEPHGAFDDEANIFAPTQTFSAASPSIVLGVAESVIGGIKFWSSASSAGSVTLQGSDAADDANITLTIPQTDGDYDGEPLLTDGTGVLRFATLPVVGGGTGRNSLTNHGVLVGAATGAITQLAVGASNTFLKGSAGADPSFGTATLAGADFANQGTTTTVLHGNTAGNPSWGLVANSDLANSSVSVTAGAGLKTGGSVALGSSVTLDVDSTEQNFLTSGALTCGASTNGKVKVHTTPLQYCDNAATPTLQYAAYGDSAGGATAVTVSAGAGPTSNGAIAYDSTANDLEYGDNGTNRKVVNLDEAQTLSSKTLTSPVINGATSSGSTSIDFSGNSGTFKTTTGATTLGSSIAWNGGTAITKHLSGTHDFSTSSVSNGACVSGNFTLSGAAVGNPCVVGTGSVDTSNWVITCWVSTVNSVRVQFCNFSGSSASLSSATYRTDVWQHP